MKDYVINGKTIETSSIEIEGIDTKDYPDFSDAFVVSAKFKDGSDLTEDECDELQNLYPDLVYQKIWNRIF